MRASSLREGVPTLAHGPGGARFACVRKGKGVTVLDDRCPHQGRPLSMGIVEGGVLTCQFHNWRFDLATGACLQGVEGVRRYPTEVVADEVFIDPATDPGATDRH